MATNTIKTNGDREEYQSTGKYSMMRLRFGRAKLIFSDVGREIIKKGFVIWKIDYREPELFAYQR